MLLSWGLPSRDRRSYDNCCHRTSCSVGTIMPFWLQESRCLILGMTGHICQHGHNGSEVKGRHCMTTGPVYVHKYTLLMCVHVLGCRAAHACTRRCRHPIASALQQVYPTARYIVRTNMNLYTQVSTQLVVFVCCSMHDTFMGDDHPCMEMYIGRTGAESACSSFIGHTVLWST